MKKIMIITVISLMIGLINVNAAFVVPTKAQITMAVKTPVQLESILKDASTKQASIVLLHVVQKVQLMDLSVDEKKDRITELFVIVQNIFGEESVIIISDVVSRMNLELMPKVIKPGAALISKSSLPISLPLAPPIAQFYTGQ